MQYQNIVEATFLTRPNRFVAEVCVNGVREIAHVKNTGRCKELLTPGALVYLDRSDNAARKTKYDLISVYKQNRLINMDSQAPNRVFAEWVRQGGIFHDITLIKPECKFQHSRFDFYLEGNGRKIFAEIKGVTLENDGVVLFPDAPTERGLKHVAELCTCVQQGYEAYLFFVVQMRGCKYFTPNKNTHPAFAEALLQAQRQGVRIYAYDCIVTPNTLKINNPVDIRLN